MLKDTDTGLIERYYMGDFQRQPFKTLFKAVAKLLVGLSLVYMLGVFAFGMVVTFAQLHLAGLASTGLSLGILLAYGYMAGRRPAV